MPTFQRLSFLARATWLLLSVAPAIVTASDHPDFSTWRMEEIRRFTTPEARQGVVADERFIYVIDNFTLGKFDKKTFARVGGWQGEKGGPVIHLNAGIIHEGKLVLAHSNFPEVPMAGSIEWFDPETMLPAGSQSIGAYFGSVNWVLRHEGAWFVCFAHYGNRAAEPNRDPTWTSLVRFDDQWRRTGGWVFPKAIYAHIGGAYTLSGGAFGPGGYLYVTGHDDPELYVMRFPKQGSVLEWLGTIPIQAEGQAFAWDPVDPWVFYSLVRSTREVVISRLIPGAAKP